MEHMVEQVCYLRAFPSPEAVLRFVDTVAATMSVPLRRFVLWGDPVREAKGAWKNRDRVEEALRNGHRGDLVEYLSVFSYADGGDNRCPRSSVSLSRREDLADSCVLVHCTRWLADGDDASRIAANWARICLDHLDPVYGAGFVDIAGRSEFDYATHFVNGGADEALEDLLGADSRPDTHDGSLYHLLELLDRREAPGALTPVLAGHMLRAVRLVNIVNEGLADRVTATLDGQAPGTMTTVSGRLVWVVPDETEQERAHDILAQAGLCQEPWISLSQVRRRSR